jgi:hypothetical protein
VIEVSRRRRARPRVYWWLVRWPLFLVLPIFCAPQTLCDSGRAWTSMDARLAVWDAVVSEQLEVPLPFTGTRPYEISSDGLEATFQKGADRWTIIGANAPIVHATVPPPDWSLKGNAAEVVTLAEPITNEYVLPFSDVIPGVGSPGVLRVRGAPDSFEAASFVIRSGEEALRDVTIEVPDLAAAERSAGQEAIIPKRHIDVRVVKCWYQAGAQLNDATHKMLKPELLLHDDNLVQVDYARQVVLVRNYDHIQDSAALLPFTIPAKQNRQIWLTVHIAHGLGPGRYSGPITIRAGARKMTLTLDVDVLPFSLPDPMLDYVLYYEGHLVDVPPTRPNSRSKTEAQMVAELLDMKEHGLTNATVWHQLGADRTKRDTDWERLRRTLELRKMVGWGGRPLLYLDWRSGASTAPDEYNRTIVQIKALASSYGVRDVFIYGLDERRGKEFIKLRPMYEAVHRAGARTFVAMTEDTYLSSAADLIDLPVLWAPSVHPHNIAKLHSMGARIWKYSGPQAGLEEPEAYRREYGLNLLAAGFAGACNYQYQLGSWNDFVDPRGRLNTMAYPTTTVPVPTTQWEGWRAGVNDVRYLTYVLRNRLTDENWLRSVCLPQGSAGCRAAAVDLIVRRVGN